MTGRVFLMVSMMPCCKKVCISGARSHNSTGLGLTIVADTLAEYGQELIMTNRQPGCQVSFLLDAHQAKRQGHPAGITCEDNNGARASPIRSAHHAADGCSRIIGAD